MIELKNKTKQTKTHNNMNGFKIIFKYLMWLFLPLKLFKNNKYII